jgi:hypothetical protein
MEFVTAAGRSSSRWPAWSSWSTQCQAVPLSVCPAIWPSRPAARRHQRRRRGRDRDPLPEPALRAPPQPARSSPAGPEVSRFGAEAPRIQAELRQPDPRRLRGVSPPVAGAHSGFHQSPVIGGHVAIGAGAVADPTWSCARARWPRLPGRCRTSWCAAPPGTSSPLACRAQLRPGGPPAPGIRARGLAGAGSS